MPSSSRRYWPMLYAVRLVLLDKPTTAHVRGADSSRLITSGSRQVLITQILADLEGVSPPTRGRIPRAPPEPPPMRESERHHISIQGRCFIIAEMIIRSIQTHDRKAWEPLWRGYLEFYRASLEPKVTEHTWATRPTCYLEDLYVAKPWRGQAIARRLIEAVYAFADESGAASVYWLTQEYNAPARSLYDTLAHRTSFVVYRR